MTDTERPTVELPDGFVFGTATAAYQIEGAVDEDGRGPSVWDTFSHTPGRIERGETGDVACDHYHRSAADVALMGDLGLDAYRFSIAWSRIQPDGTGAPNQKGLDFYARLVDDLLAHDMEPAVTLFHWDHPQALEDRGGWQSRDMTEWFAEYAGIVADRLGDRVSMWMPLNEPFVDALLGHALGLHAPGLTLGQGVLPVIHHLLLGHGLAAQAIRAAASGDVRVGIAQHLAVAHPATDDPADEAAAHAMQTLHVQVFTDPLLRASYPDLDQVFPGVDTSAIRDGDLATIAQPLDWFGVNYYAADYVQAAPPDFPATFIPTDPPTSGPRTAMGWEINPAVLTDVLVHLGDRYGDDLPPVYITESGVAFDDAPDDAGFVQDDDRIAYLAGHLGAVRDAIDAGVDVRGYFVWSLMDNFEWAEGYRPRFGIVRVDYGTQQRTPKASALWYRDLAAAHRSR